MRRSLVRILEEALRLHRDVAQLVARRVWDAEVTGSNPVIPTVCSVRLGVRTPGFHPGSRGSNPLRSTGCASRGTGFLIKSRVLFNGIDR